MGKIKSSMRGVWFIIGLFLVMGLVGCGKKEELMKEGEPMVGE